jgi:hypothetical protein
MFSKLSIPEIHPNIEKIKGNCTMKTRMFLEYEIKDMNYLNELLENKIHFGIPPTQVNLTEILYPGPTLHTDGWSVAMNIYLTAGNDVTSFWQFTNKDRIHNPSKLTFYAQASVEQIGEFKANVMDCYLLDVHKIHTVKVNEPNSVRQILRFTWATNTFDEVLKSISFGQ